ncbi:MAG TPA: VOC family protein [Polyangia bacterium]|nr:VOC family protein [Polyangia bacterium]
MFESLDFLYVPARELEASVRYYVDVLGGVLRWKIHAFNAWVARVDLAKEGPPVLLADHKHGVGPQLVYRVADFDAAVAELRARGWTPDGEPFEIPSGPCASFRDPTGNQLAIYENRRPEATRHFDGRFDRAD